ncbi:MAG: LytR C-terminal domain-containing protein [Nocardioidaceae bacterium]
MGDRLKHALTLLALVAIVVVGALWGWQALTKPFPSSGKAADDSPCAETAVVQGSGVRPGQVWLSVLNASDRNGLAGDTLDKLVARGFAEGATGNAPDGTEVRTVEVWAADPASPAALLVKSYLPRATVVEHDELDSRVTVVVGQQFTDLREGKKLVVAASDATICSPR